jgi:proteasome accessory factor B
MVQHLKSSPAVKPKRKPDDFPRSRPPLARMMQIHQALQSGSFPNCTTLGRQLEVSTKSIQRDLDFMRDRMELPIEFDSLRNGYHYTAEVASFPTLQITEGELFALLVAEKALQQYRGTNFEKPLVSAFKKMASALPDTVSLNFADWEQSISFVTRAEPILNLEIFDQLAQATARHEQLEIHYRKPGQSAAEKRLVDPYHLANINGEWFLFAFDHGRRDLRTFVPSRIKAVRATGKQFTRPAKFSLQKRLQDSFGVHSGGGEFNVVLRFDEWASDYIREKKWHASQQLRELKDGGVELALKLSGLLEIERWVLSWGQHVRVLAPRELRERVRMAGKALAQGHAD